MKLLSFCLFIAILSTKLCNADDECFEQKIDLIVNGTCVSGKQTSTSLVLFVEFSAINIITHLKYISSSDGVI